MTHVFVDLAMQAIVDKKNNWLCQHVNVLYPTPESIQGRDLYLSLNRQQQVTPLAFNTQHGIHLNNIYLVDFHRLTIMFALLQASRCPQEEQRALLVEFFTQIIYSSPCSLFLGFVDTQPVAAALLTECEQSVLISDIVIHNQKVLGTPNDFACAVFEKWLEGRPFSGRLYIESELPTSGQEE
ncbi:MULTISPECIES: hypothetical protein [unclassified Vibrio]|uniref:hypothetical protein n=1 Tax=unclassified Vibrio TaxID=2614977 RepID=UPI001EF0A434|nr:MULTISPECIES: hypothetical protein [unclassified Vibrio]